MRDNADHLREEAHHLREEAQRARWWAVSVSDPVHRERIEAVAREYEERVRSTEREEASRNN
jgi:TPP-dependent trihydroxycyclohexane-1,2-dione (THcHDO) dehydratase